MVVARRVKCHTACKWGMYNPIVPLSVSLLCPMAWQVLSDSRLRGLKFQRRLVQIAEFSAISQLNSPKLELSSAD